MSTKNIEEKLGDDFYKLLESYSISDDSPIDDVKIFINKVSTWLKKNLPPKLYRYRTCTDYNIESIKNGEIYGSSLLSLNDNFEGLLSFDLKKINKDCQEAIAFEKIEEFINILNENGYPSRFGKMLSPETKLNFDKNISEILKYKESNMEQIKKYIRDFGKIFINEVLNKEAEYLLNEIFRNNNIYRGFKKIACFTTNYESELMWGHYADSSKGFVIEYDLTEIINSCNFECGDNIRGCQNLGLNYLLAPVIYKETRYDATDYLVQYLMFNTLSKIENQDNPRYFELDKLLYLKLLLYKSKEWKYENEWRLIGKTTNETIFEKPECILKCKPKKIYLGTKITTENKKKIIDICKKENILYDDMQIDYLGNEYSIKSKKYFEENNKPILKVD